MPEPHSDVFGDVSRERGSLEDLEGENVTMLAGKKLSQIKHQADLDMDQPQESYTCSLGRCIVFFFIVEVVVFLVRLAATPDGCEGATLALVGGSTTLVTPTSNLGPAIPTRLAPENFTSLESTEKALACMRLSDPGLEAKYPMDAEAHFEDIYQNISSFVPMDFPMHVWAGYEGPWIENWWIRNFTQKWFNRSPGTKLRDIFGPFIPIFAPWTDLAVRKKSYPKGMMEMLKEKMRKDVLYVTVSFHDLGVFGGAEATPVNRKDFTNLFVFSSGGHGHVPIPMLKQPMQPLPEVPMRSRKYVVSFIGNFITNRRVRGKMKEIADKWSNKTQKLVYVQLHGERQWIEVLKNSSAALSPRGFGRSSFRTGELLQMGRVPVYLWSDVAWIFYRELWEKEVIGFSSHFEKLETTLDRIAALGPDYLQTMEKRILSMRNSHFSYQGIMDQIARYLTGSEGGSDLRCNKFPKQCFHIPRDCEAGKRIDDALRVAS